jgi:hypothetical protein
MSFSNLFGKSKKRKSKSSSSKEMNEVFGDPSLQEKRVAAATDVMKLFDRYFKPTEQEVHVETVLYSAACLAGTSLFRSFGFSQSTEPGSVILSDQANQGGSNLMNLFMFFIQNYGVTLQPDQLAITFTDTSKPKMTILQVQENLQDSYHAIMEKHGLSYLDGARAGIVVCSMLYGHHCANRKDIDLGFGAGIIGRGLIEGAKTSPLPLDPNKATIII